MANLIAGLLTRAPVRPIRKSGVAPSEAVQGVQAAWPCSYNHAFEVQHRR